MEHLPQLIIDLALLLAVAGVTTLLCRWLKQPVVLGYVIAGFLISPGIGFFPNIGDKENIEILSELGMIFLLFGLGLEFSILKLTSVGKPSIIIALTEGGLMILAGFACGSLLGWGFYDCIFLGGMLAISSTTIIIKVFDELGMKGRKFTELVFGALVMEDIAGIFLMVILSTIAVGTAATEGAAVVFQVSQMVLYLIIWFLVSIIVIPTFLQKARKGLSDEIILIISIALCLGMVVLANAIGFSAALGAFVAGSILAGTVQATRIEKLFKPIKDLFGAVFFVSVGMLVSPQLVIDYAWAILAVTIVTLIGKPLFTTLGGLFARQTVKTATQVGMSLSQIGEFSFIIAALGLSLGVTSDFLYPIIVAVSVVTTLTTPFYIRSTDKVTDLIQKILPNSFSAWIDRKAQVDTEPKEESLWANYLKHWFVKIFMVIIAALASVEILKTLLTPLLIQVVPEPVVGFINTIFALVITGLFIANLFSGARKGDFALLWAEGKNHHIPLVLIATLGFLVSAGMTIYTILALDYGTPWLIIPALLLTLLFGRSQKLHSWFLQLENRFLGNLHEQELAERKADSTEAERIRWAEDRLFATEVKITKIGKQRGKPIPVAYFISRACNLDILSIKREGKSLYKDELMHLTKESLRQRLRDPDDHLSLKKGDRVTFFGTEDEIETFNNNMIKADALSEDDAWSENLRPFLKNNDDLNDLICFSLRIDAQSEFKGRTISAIDFKENYGCQVIGLEHNYLPVIKPSKNTKLFQRDLVLMLGSKDMAEFFNQAATEVLITPLPDTHTPEEQTLN